MRDMTAPERLPRLLVSLYQPEPDDEGMGLFIAILPAE
jgi:hypothetical protein